MRIFICVTPRLSTRSAQSAREEREEKRREDMRQSVVEERDGDLQAPQGGGIQRPAGQMELGANDTELVLDGGGIKAGSTGVGEAMI
jgi:hypothetical protein